MKAAVNHEYGAPEVVTVQEVPRPTPGAGQVLIRVLATTVNSGDARLRGANFPRGFGPVARLVFGLRRPRRQILGGVFSGVVEAVGEGVAEGWLGDEVAGMNGGVMGCHAQYVVVSAKRLARKPKSVSHRDAAAAMFGGTTALHFLRDKAAVRAGERVLINGASGSVGSAAASLAHQLGAHVTGVCSGPHAGVVTAAGADRVIDYTQTPLAQLEERFDVVVDTVGNLGIEGGRRLLAPGGRLCLVAADLPTTLRARGNAFAGVSVESAAAFAGVLAQLESGALKPVIEEVLPLERIREAHARVDSGHKGGNLVIEP